MAKKRIIYIRKIICFFKLLRRRQKRTKIWGSNTYWEYAMAKQKRKKKHRLFWFFVRLQFVLMLVVIAGFFYYNYGGYGKLVQDFFQGL